ncbi:MAG: carbohydrate kinase family protein [Anaerolineae bacterium]
MNIVCAGSVAYDYIMSFPGHFSDHILPDQIEILSVSFLVDSMRRERGGNATNIAHNLRLLGERPRVMATVGQDFGSYREWLEARGIDTSLIKEIEDDFTASFFVSTDQENRQIASFYTGAMGHAGQVSFHDLDPNSIDIAIISPNDPDAMAQYVRECRELGISYIYDPSQQIIRLDPETLVEGIAGSLMFIANDYEYGLIKRKTGLTSEDIQNMVDTVIVTCSEKGSYIMVGDRRIDIPAVPPRRNVDPTGVGDAYRAGVIAGYLRGYSWESTGRIGALAATYVLERTGTQNHEYTLEEFAERYCQVFGDGPEVEDLRRRGKWSEKVDSAGVGAVLK